MKFNCGLPAWKKAEIKEAKLKEWHKKFAWWPIRVNDYDCRWLEFVLRRGTLHDGYDGDWWTWEYQAYTIRGVR